MKFGKQLEEYELPEWRGHYIPYKLLKRRLEEMKTPGQCTPTSPGVLLATGLIAPLASSAKGPAPDTSGTWLRCVEEEAVRVGDFVDRGLKGLEAQLEDLSKTAETLRGIGGSGGGPDAGGGLGAVAASAREARTEDAAAESDEGSFLELRVLEAVGRVAEGLQRLRGFAELNHAALYKILKKHDKQLGSRDGLGQLFPRLVVCTRLADTVRLDALDAELRRLSLQSSQTEGLDASPEVARLAAGLGRSHGAAAGRADTYSATERNEMVLCFFLGSSTALFLAIGVLLALPGRSPHSFSTAYFLTPIPVFRVVFSVLLSLWCMGAVARTCEKWDINHLFILGVDPRCRIKAEFFFSRAATLTTLWILIFGMYVVDYKWRVLPTVWAHEGYNKRASWHFVIYPVLLLAATSFGMLWPSRICRNRYKASVVRSVRRTALAPLYPVDFADNIVGDVLTSLAKPLQDVPAAVCYLVSSHPQAEMFVDRFVQKGDTCSNTTHHVILPIIAGLPYVFRAMQCLRRFRDKREARHLWNFGKYVSSLLVVVVSSVWWSSLVAVTAVSAIATIYAAAWDVLLDWGLGRHDFLGAEGSDPSGKQAASEPVSKANPDGRLKAPRVKNPERHFVPRVYWLCSVLDLIARSTWVLTLMPINIITGNIVGRVVLVSIISSIEILRRSMWAVLRIEYEQVANASGFRALLWVPSKLNVAEHRPSGFGLTGARQPLLST